MIIWVSKLSRCSLIHIRQFLRNLLATNLLSHGQRFHTFILSHDLVAQIDFYFIFFVPSVSMLSVVVNLMHDSLQCICINDLMGAELKYQVAEVSSNLNQNASSFRFLNAGSGFCVCGK